MVEHEWQQLRDNPDWAHVLAAYATRAAADRELHTATPQPDAAQSAAAAETSPEPAAAAPEPAQPAANAGQQGWVCRLTQVEGVSETQLSAIHGKLIAFGFLNFELTSRTTGMRYQVAPLGRRVLRWLETDRLETDRTSDADKQAA